MSILCNKLLIILIYFFFIFWIDSLSWKLSPNEINLLGLYFFIIFSRLKRVSSKSKGGTRFPWLAKVSPFPKSRSEKMRVLKFSKKIEPDLSKINFSP